MKPVTVSTQVSKPSAEVFDYLETIANHEQFLGKIFDKWEFSGPQRGVGARAHARQNAPGSNDWIDLEFVEVDPGRIVEKGVSAGGKRETLGTYLIEELPDGGTKISFELEWLRAPRSERIGPFGRAFVRRAYGGAIRRLGKRLDES
jgi:hypothetical protein